MFKTPYGVFLKKGQLWYDNDSRGLRRIVMIVGFEPKEKKVKIATFNPATQSAHSRVNKALLSRFDGSGRGYSYCSDAHVGKGSKK